MVDRKSTIPAQSCGDCPLLGTKWGIAVMNNWTRSIAVACLGATSFVALPTVAEAGIGDLLVAPTRVVLDGRKGAEVILNNIGDDAATYRVSIEFRRMTESGDLVDVATPTDQDVKAEDMIVYAPRKVTLAPHEPQAIRIAARAPEGLPDGEYRVHMLFRAIPPATPIAQPAGEAVKGVQFKLTPVYGVTIPVIVRLGNLQATAAIANVHLETANSPVAPPVKPGTVPSPLLVEPSTAPSSGLRVALDLMRQGTRSTYGEVRVMKAGIKEPIADAKGIAVYTEVGKRHVTLTIPETYKSVATGRVTVQYVETFDDGNQLLAETQAVLR
jgi:P pilus assembly chaperone PapD